MPARPQAAPTDDWQQIELLARAPGQRTYELIRPVVLFGQSPAERAAETGAAQRTLYRHVARFDQLGIVSLVPPPKVEKHRLLPVEVRQAILDAKREHPPLNVHSHTVKRILAEEEFAGLPDKPRAPHRPATKVTLRAIATVKELQENPLLGEFRIHAALKRPAQAGAGSPGAHAHAVQSGATAPVLAGGPATRMARARRDCKYVSSMSW